jgi:hypothetical protein
MNDIIKLQPSRGFLAVRTLVALAAVSAVLSGIVIAFGL